ncbi:MAG: hypothetical protein DMG75_10440 [Acidobacteria bacterium]|nr:MAG: hypothetical protein DMG75_10440 [Acidobacteriota bacterium]
MGFLAFAKLLADAALQWQEIHRTQPIRAKARPLQTTYDCRVTITASSCILAQLARAIQGT